MMRRENRKGGLGEREVNERWEGRRNEGEGE